jgi:hypothetical protein
LIVRLHICLLFFVGLLIPSAKMAACGGIVKGECRSLSRMLLAQTHGRDSWLGLSCGSAFSTSNNTPATRSTHTNQHHPPPSSFTCSGLTAATTRTAYPRRLRCAAMCDINQNFPSAPHLLNNRFSPIRNGMSASLRYPPKIAVLTEHLYSTLTFASHVGPQAQSR